ncbi:unnamed protein product [Spirodela intermedia]|uniref:Uncharacterized protein n=1 Tax=Spirodela intermedia TaxID=51605 RepID=A0A7I8JQE3_SPIIN|nr:unnamed protein product [Spirodela intermedia]CAA6672378.1 unnamed protein product [Spirodela intermedia]
MEVEEGMPGSRVGEGVDVLVKVETNGDVVHKEHPMKGVADSDEIGNWAVDQSLPKSAGYNPVAGKMNGDAIRVAATSPMPNSTPDQSPASGSISIRWRRVRRDISKEEGVITDPSRVIKRGFSVTESSKVLNENKQKSDLEGKDVAASIDSRSLQGVSNAQDIELELLEAVGSFSVGKKSENSDERSNTSSAAGSITRTNHEGLGYEKERDRARNFRGKFSGNVAQVRGQRRKGGPLQINKKLRGDQVKLEKDDSHSSVESDLRSSNAVYAEWGSTSTNGKQSEGSSNFDGLVDHVETQKRWEDVEDTSRDELHEDVFGKDNLESRQSCTPSEKDGDPFAESLNLLHAVHETLEKGTLPLLASTFSVVPSFDYLNPSAGEIGRDASARPNHEEGEGSSSASVENELNQEEALHKTNQLEEKEMEEEVEGLFRKSVEEEVKCFIFSAALGEARAHGEPPVNERLRAAEEEAALLKSRLEQVAAFCRGLEGTEEVLRLRHGVYNVSLRWLAQLVLLLVAVVALVAQIFFPPATAAAWCLLEPEVEQDESCGSISISLLRSGL